MLSAEKNISKIPKKGYSHSKTYLRYHIIFVTKYRKKLLNDIRQTVFDAFTYCESKSHFTILKMNLDQDHIHLLISIPVEYSIAQTVSRLKQMTTNYLYREKNDYMRKFYRKNRVVWTPGYFCSTIGHISEDIASKYIETQGKEHYI